MGQNPSQAQAKIQAKSKIKSNPNQNRIKIQIKSKSRANPNQDLIKSLGNPRENPRNPMKSQVLGLPSQFLGALPTTLRCSVRCTPERAYWFRGRVATGGRFQKGRSHWLPPTGRGAERRLGVLGARKSQDLLGFLAFNQDFLGVPILLLGF